MNRPYRVGIDCRFWGLKHAGLGRYTRELVLEILKLEHPDIEFTLFFQKGEWQEDKTWLKNTKIVEVDIPHYSLKEQLLFGKAVDKEGLDLIHFAHFNVPLLLDTPFIVTIHDLIKHFFKGRPVTTRHALIYWIKYGGYRLTIGNAIRHSKDIIVPSIFTKDQIVAHYPGLDPKITITYEGVSPEYYPSAKTDGSAPGNKAKQKYGISKPFFIYTGSAYPSKDIPTLLEAVKQVSNRGMAVQLVIACARNVFWDRLKEQVNNLELTDSVLLPGKVPDSDLKVLYKQAMAFVMPSLMEGFGLPALEAMSVGCPVISSDAGSLPEIYEDGAIYFSGGQAPNLAQQLEKVNHFSLKDRTYQIKLGQERAKQFRWTKTAKDTVAVYYNTLRHLPDSIK